jgi:hypothetical protein
VVTLTEAQDGVRLNASDPTARKPCPSSIRSTAATGTRCASSRSETAYWLTLGECLALHDMMLSHYGGIAGVRDMHLLQSALARPQQLPIGCARARARGGSRTNPRTRRDRRVTTIRALPSARTA